MAILKLGLVGDPHYASTDFSYGANRVGYRTQVLTWLDRFNARMATFAPDIVATLGDNSTAASAADKTSRLVAVASKIAERPAGTEIIGLGNHDFEYATPAEVRAVLAASQTYLVAGKLYGSFDVGDFHVIVLDGNYLHTTPFAHFSALGLSSEAHGYIPDGTDGSDDELGWLTADLAATTKRTIVFCHQTLDEYDGSTFYVAPTSDFERYSVTNRAAVRSVLEASGKVIAVFHGHQHQPRTDVIRGIPYIHAPSLSEVSAYPTRLITDSNRGWWLEVTIDTSIGKITVDLREDHSTRGAELSTRRTVYYSAFGDDVASPFQAYAESYAAAIGDPAAGLTGAPSYDSGEVTQWTVVTETVNYVPTTGMLALSRATEPGSLVWRRTVAAGAASSATRRIASQSGSFQFPITVRPAQTTKRMQLHLANSAGVAGPSIAFDASGNLVTADGTVLQAYEADTDYEVVFSVDVAADTYDLWVNGTTLATGIPFASSLAAIDRVTFEWPTGHDGTAYLGPMFVGFADVTAPTASLTASATGTTINATVSGTDETAPDAAPYACGLSPNPTNWQADGAFSFAGLSPGTHTVYGRVRDAAGSITSATRTVEVAAPAAVGGAPVYVGGARVYVGGAPVRVGP